MSLIGGFLLPATAQIIETSQPTDTLTKPMATSDTTGLAPDSVKTQAPSLEKKPENYGTITEIKAKNIYKPAEVVAELKKGKFGKPVNVEKDTVHWKKGGVFGLTLNQGSLQNWAAGGDNFSMSLGAAASLYANYANKRNNWDNNIDMAFGYLNTTSLGTRKNDDKLNFYSKYGYRFSKSWYYSAMVSFRSQFANGYHYPDDSTVVSHFLAPAYVLASIGFNFKPADYFSVFISPVTSRFVIVNDQRMADIGAYGVDSARYDYHDSTRTLISKGKKMRYEFGPYLSAQFKKEILKNITWNSRLDLYANYLHNPQNVDVYFTSLFTFKVNKFITASISTELIYDDDIKFITYKKNADGSIKTNPVTGEQAILKQGARTQFKEQIGIGFAYQF